MATITTHPPTLWERIHASGAYIKALSNLPPTQPEIPYLRSEGPYHPDVIQHRLNTLKKAEDNWNDMQKRHEEAKKEEKERKKCEKKEKKQKKYGGGGRGGGGCAVLLHGSVGFRF
jgi:hypothetical protein